MRVAVVGVGYVGLPTVLLLAKAGHDVLAVDRSAHVVESLNAGRAHLEPRVLQPLFDEPEIRGRIRASATPEGADAFLITVPTPLTEGATTADLSMVEDATGALAPHLEPGNLVAVESTIPPRTCRDRVRPILEKGSGLRVPQDVRLAHAPERVFPGDMLREIVHNERLVGGLDEASTTAARELYQSFVEGEIHETDDVTAELTKLLENTYRDVNLALANEIGLLAARLDVDAGRAIDLANRHPRVNILRPGIGVGGHCIPVDPWFLSRIAGSETPLIEAARRVNDAVPTRVARALHERVRPKRRVLLLGAAYKPEVGDCRESPALAIATELRRLDLEVEHLDPLVAGMQGDLASAMNAADLVAVLVPHTCILRELEALGEPRAPVLHVGDLLKSVR